MIESNFNFQLDFENQKNHLLLNPRLNTDEKRQLFKLSEIAIQKLNLNSHVFIATSGSTQEKSASLKLVALSKKALLESARSVNSFLQVTSNDIWGQVLPLHHVGGFGIEARAFLSKSKVENLLDTKWNEHDFVERLRLRCISLTSLVPTQVFDIVKNNLIAPKSLRAIIVGGGSLSEHLYNKARELGWPLLPSFGMTECCSQIATAELKSLQANVFPKLKILDHVQCAIEADFLKVNSESLLTSYIQEIDNKIRIWDPKQSSWFKTEDKVEISDGFLIPLGREGDFIKIGAESTSLTRLRALFEKNILDNKFEIQSFALNSRESQRLENEIVLYGTKDVMDVKKLIDQFNLLVMPFERIREYICVENIPQTDLGKVQYKRIKKEQNKLT